ncbi:hypothetical protein EDB86DRAFT_2832246 [Lactarius hatsudake]|nr:hypothetical protein EDB86DRAFT_2832246 [Lactarius hatsudake]
MERSKVNKKRGELETRLVKGCGAPKAKAQTTSITLAELCGGLTKVLARLGGMRRLVRTKALATVWLGWRLEWRRRRWLWLRLGRRRGFYLAGNPKSAARKAKAAVAMAMARRWQGSLNWAV